MTLFFIDSNDSITFDFDPFGGGAIDTIVFENDPEDPFDDEIIDVFDQSC